MTHLRTSVYIVDKVGKDAAKLGATLPADFLAEHDKVLQLIDRAGAFNPTKDLPDAVIDALAAGRDPLKDAAVARAAVSQAVATSMPAVETALNLRVFKFVEDHAETMLTAFREPYEKAAQKITTALEVLGDVALDQSAEILALGGDAARTWIEAREADSAIDLIMSTWTSLGTISSALRLNGMYRSLAIADVEPARFIDDQMTNKTIRAWDLARAGHRLSMASPTEFQARIDSIQDTRARRVREWENESNRAASRTFRMTA